jgi:hypothetical protein
VDGEEEEIHISKIHPYYFDANHTSPRDAAMRDVLTLFDVEAVLNHTGLPPPRGKKSEMEFLVKFLGYDEEYNLWLPWAELRDNRALHQYLLNNRMRSLIPSKFRDEYRQ